MMMGEHLGTVVRGPFHGWKCVRQSSALELHMSTQEPFRDGGRHGIVAREVCTSATPQSVVELVEDEGEVEHGPSNHYHRIFAEKGAFPIWDA